MTVLWMVCQGIQFYCHFQKNYYNGEVQESQITSEVSNPTVSTLFKQGTIVTVNATDTDFADEQNKDMNMNLQTITNYFKESKLPQDQKLAYKIVTKVTLYTMSDGILYYTL